MKRIFSIDLLRGLIIVIMALDHTREFVNAGALHFNPEDLTKTTYAYFFTRWITHFCAPVFAFTAGLGAYLRGQRGLAHRSLGEGGTAELSKFLWTRGLWLVFLEFTAVRLAFFFRISIAADPTFLLVFWMLGISMIVLAGLVWLPWRILAIVSVAMIALHNLLDPIAPASLGAYGWIWNVLHQPGAIHMDPVIIAAYPLIPWIGVMSAGFCFGRMYQMPHEKRRRALIGLGLGLTATFIALRLLNVYGDLRPWAAQPQPGFTLLAFIKTNKYPPSLDYLLMTLGPAITFLGIFDRVQLKTANPFIVFGRTPQLFFIVHLAVIHLFAIALGYWRYGSQPFLWLPSPSIGGAAIYPDGYGWSLKITYLVWMSVVITMYPLCRWLANLKASRRAWWLSYL